MIKKLKKEFFNLGFNYKQLMVGEKTFLYELSLPSSGRVTGYHVFKKKIDPSFTNFGVLHKGRVKYPTYDSYGKWAWEFLRLKLAKKKFQELEGLNK